MKFTYPFGPFSEPLIALSAEADLLRWGQELLPHLERFSDGRAWSIEPSPLPSFRYRITVPSSYGPPDATVATVRHYSGPHLCLRSPGDETPYTFFLTEIDYGQQTPPGPYEKVYSLGGVPHRCMAAIAVVRLVCVDLASGTIWTGDNRALTFPVDVSIEQAAADVFDYADREQREQRDYLLGRAEQAVYEAPLRREEG